MADIKANKKRQERIRYQRTDKYKEYTRTRYLDKVKHDSVCNLCKLRRTGEKELTDNEFRTIMDQILQSNNTKDVHDIMKKL